MLIDVRFHDPRVNTTDVRRIERRAADALAGASGVVQQVTVRLESTRGAGNAAARGRFRCRIIVRCAHNGYTVVDAVEADPIAALDRGLTRLQRDLRLQMTGGPVAAPAPDRPRPRASRQIS